MSTFQQSLKSDIIRLARHEIKQAVKSLKSTMARNRHVIASLKVQIATLSKQATKPVEPTVPGVSDKELKKARFSGKLIRSLRTKLGLTRDQFGKLVGVTGYAVIPWETNQCRPNALRQKAIVALRKMGRREVTAMVEAGKTVVG